MACVSVSTELVYAPRKRSERFKSDYNVDIWREVKKRWLVFGVLSSLMAAVVTSHAGAPGGVLHTEYLRYVPLWYIYYVAGVRSRGPPGLGPPARPPRRLLALSVLHAHVVAPALCLLIVEAFRGSGVDHRIVKGAVLSSVGAGCGWLSVSLRPAPPAPALAAACYVTSLLAEPALMLVLCGRATVPPLGGILSTVLTTLTPYALGAWHQRAAGASEMARGSDTRVRAAAMLLLYAECCERLREAEGSLYVGDVLVTLLLVVCWVVASASWCVGYGCSWAGGAGGGGGGARPAGGGGGGGALRGRDARALAAAAVPKCLDVGWESSISCVPSGLSRLPAVFIAPAQALLLAPFLGDEDDRDQADGGDDDDTLTVVGDDDAQ